jgi:hypothetical protein
MCASVLVFVPIKILDRIEWEHGYKARTWSFDVVIDNCIVYWATRIILVHIV